MKLNRLIEIITILMNKRNVTASELAERFNVSTRTIYRDIDVLSGSGVPIYTSQGVGGGISIMEDYSINRTLLSEQDKDSILVALQTLQSTKYPEADSVVEKIGSIFKGNAGEWIKIDFSPWGSNPNSNNRFLDIKSAILQSRRIMIDYINAQNVKSTRLIEPLQLQFKFQAWYLYGYCLTRQDYRTFRISRIKNVKLTDTLFDRNQIHLADGGDITHINTAPEKPMIFVKLLFTEEALHKIYDDFDIEMIKDNGDGTYSVEVYYPDEEWVYSYILSFGTYVKVIEPEYLKKIINEKVLRMIEYYE